MEYLYSDDYPDDDAQDPNDGHWCPECGELREICQCEENLEEIDLDFEYTRWRGDYLDAGM